MKRFPKLHKAIHCLVLFFFCWSGMQLYQLAWAFEGSTAQAPEASPWVELNRVLAQIEDTLADLAQNRGNREDLLHTLSDLLGRLEAADEDIRALLAKTGAELEEADAPDALMQKHLRKVSSYEKQADRYMAKIEEILSLSGSPEEQAAKALALWESMQNRRKPDTPPGFSPDNLPHRLPKATPREPRLGKAPAKKNKKKEPLLLASLSLFPILSYASLLALEQPVAADLAETMEVKFTDEINQKANQLGKDPVAIYEYVRNNIDYEPTYGSIKGAAQTLWEMSGNDFDQASLLIALLRASGIACRYEYGTVDIPIEEAKNWVDVDDPQRAADLLSSGGIPVTQIVDGQDIVALRIEHVWVKAFLDYTPSRGKVFVEGDRWVRLDPSFKQYELVPGIDFDNQFDADEQALWDEMTGTSTRGDNWATDLAPAIFDNRFPGVTTQYDDYVATHPWDAPQELLGFTRTIKQELGLIPCTDRYEIAAILSEYAEVPNAKRHSLSITVQYYDDFFQYWDIDFTYSAYLPALAGKPIALAYEAADQASRNYIEGRFPDMLPGETIEEWYARIPKTLDPGMVTLKPDLRVDGASVATGRNIGMGYNQVFQISISSPGGYNNSSVSNTITAGTYQMMVLNLGGSSSGYAEKRSAAQEALKTAAEGGDISGVTPDNTIGEMLFAVGQKYWGTTNLFDKVAEKMAGVAATRLPSLGIFATTASVTWSGILTLEPTNYRPAGFGTDIDFNTLAVVSPDGDTERIRHFMSLSGMLGSYLEAEIWDQALYDDEGQRPEDGVSTVHVLLAANQAGIPIYNLDSGNWGSLQGSLTVSASVKNAISSVVAQGQWVIIPRDPVTIGNWTGAGYVVTDPVTGAGAYMIADTSGGDFEPAPTLPDEAALPIAGMFAVLGGLMAVGATNPPLYVEIYTIGMGCYDLLVNISKILADPFLEPGEKDMIISFLTMMTLIGAGITAAAVIFPGGSMLAMAAVSIMFTALSLVATTIMTSIIPLIAARRAAQGGSFTNPKTRYLAWGGPPPFDRRVAAPALAARVTNPLIREGV